MLHIHYEPLIGSGCMNEKIFNYIPQKLPPKTYVLRVESYFVFFLQGAGEGGKRWLSPTSNDKRNIVNFVYEKYLFYFWI